MDFNDLKTTATNEASDNVLSLDDITGAFATRTQRQDYYEPQPATNDDGSAVIETDLINPDPAADDAPDVEEPTQIDPELAAKSGYMMARVVDTGFSFVASSFIAKNDKDYKARPQDVEFAGELWAQIQCKHGWTMGPETQLALLYGIMYGPLVKEAINDRRLAELEARTTDLERRMAYVMRDTETNRNDGKHTEQNPDQAE